MIFPKSNFSVLSIMLTLFILIWGISFLFSQERTGNITGTVIDEDGNPLPGVTIEATSPKLIGKATVVTSSEGFFRLRNLPPGIYKLTLTLSGFKTEIREGIVVKMGDTSNIEEVAMLTTAIDEKITVTAVSPVIDVEKTAIELATTSYVKKLATNLYESDGAIREDISNLTESIKKIHSILNELKDDLDSIKNLIGDFQKEDFKKKYDDLSNRLKKIEEKIK